MISSPGLALRSVQRPRQQVEAQIRTAITSGTLAAGSKLPSEMALAKEFGVSRTTVREALRTLVTDGYIEKVPGAGGGSFVRLIDRATFSRDLGQTIEGMIRVGTVHPGEAAEMRRWLEVPAVRGAALHHTADQIAELRHIVDLEKELTYDDAEVPELDVRFHSLIGEASGNRVIAALVVSFHRVTEPVARLQLDDQVARRSVRQHVAIVKAIAQSDPGSAERAMLDHLSYLELHRESGGRA